MNDFWVSGLGEVTGDASDAFAKSFKIVPDNTRALAKIEIFKNDEINGSKFLKIQWLLTDGEFKGQTIEQKIKVFGDDRARDPERARYRALNMFKLLYDMYKLKPAHGGAPTDSDLSVFLGKTAGILIRETEPEEGKKQYNWVGEIHPADGFTCETGKSLVIVHKPKRDDGLESAFSRNAAPSAMDEIEDDTPF